MLETVRGRRLARRFLVFLLGILLVVPVQSTSAQEAGEPVPPSDEEGRFEIVGELKLPEGTELGAGTNGGNYSDLRLWPEGRRGYLVAGKASAPAAGSLGSPDPNGLVSVDLDTLEEVARSEEGALPFLDQNLDDGLHQGLDIDPETGDLFVAHHNLSEGGTEIPLAKDVKETCTPATPSVCVTADGDGGSPLLGSGTVPDTVDENQVSCQPSTTATPCFAGVYQVDGETLALKRNIRFFARGLDGAQVQLALAALSYAPPRMAGDSPKLLAVLFEVAHRPIENTEPFGVPSYSRAAQQYAVQIDVESGEADWVSSLSGCTGAPVSGVNKDGPFGHPVIFRSPDPTRPVVWAGCWAGGRGVSGVVRLDIDESDPSNPGVSGQRRFVAPGGARGFLADPASDRILVRTTFDESLWWVFDGREGGFVSRVDIGAFSIRQTGSVVDAKSGRLLMFAPRRRAETAADRHPGGLGLADIRRTPVPQPQWDSSFAPLWRDDSGAEDAERDTSNLGIRMAVDPATNDRPRRLFLRTHRAHEGFLVIEDHEPVSTDPADEGGGSDSDDVPEAPGLTASEFNASARGYGLRSIWLSGVYGIAGQHPEATPFLSGLRSPCFRADRVMTFGLAGSPQVNRLASIDHFGSATASARALHMDETGQQDVDTPYSRCHARSTPSWEEIEQQAQVRGVEEPRFGRPPGSASAACALPDRPEDRQGDDVFTGLSAEVSCQPGTVSMDSRAAALTAGPLSVASAGSTVDVSHEEGGGVVARVDSWTRGLSVMSETGAVELDEVRTQVTAWANGRTQPEEVADDPNCDTGRTAGSCLVRTFAGARVYDADGSLVFSCEQCNDPELQRQFVEGMQRALGSSWLVTSREPDAMLAAGSPEGTLAAVVKPEPVRFADENLKADLLPTVPALELVRLNDTDDRPGRQVFQFAGVEADLSYSINCLFSVIDGECRAEPASVEIALTDVDGRPLEGGLFQVQPDPNGDGEIDLEESTLETHTCTTGPDGTCTITNVAPGTYVVHQAAAPPGFLPAPNTAVNLPKGAQARIDVVNGTPSVTGIAISLHDRSTPPAPLEGGEFQVHAGTGLAEVPLATCTTNDKGVCVFAVTAAVGIEPIASVVGQDITNVLQVAPGPYVIHQASAPDGYEPIDDIAFELPAGQIARVGLTNGVVAANHEAGSAPAPAAPSDGGSREEAPPPTSQPSEQPVAMEAPQPVPKPQITINVQQPAQEPSSQVAGPEGDTYNIFQNPVQAAKLLLRDPKEAASFGAAWLLFGAALAGAWRRRMILAQFEA